MGIVRNPMLHFFLKQNRAYLDWASAAPVHPEAARAFRRALRAYGNPSSPHEEGLVARKMLEDARARIARLAGVKPRAVLFTSGATEANNLAVQGRIERCLAEGKQVSELHVLYLPTMHSSVLAAIEQFARRGMRAEPIVMREGGIDLDAFRTQLTPQTVLVCADAVCGETGIRYDTRRLKQAIEAAARGAEEGAAPGNDVLLHVDASQLPLVERIERTRLGADLLVLDAQKVGGARGAGALIVPDSKQIAPLMHGGGQEGGLRPGTEPVALIAAFARALEVRAEGQAAFAEAARASRTLLMRAVISAASSAGVQAVVHEGKQQAPHILSVSLPGIDTDYLVALLDADGIAVSTKSACETDSDDGSKAVLALTNDQGLAKATVRISWGPETPSSALRRFPRTLAEALAFLAQD